MRLALPGLRMAPTRAVRATARGAKGESPRTRFALTLNVLSGPVFSHRWRHVGGMLERSGVLPSPVTNTDRASRWYCPSCGWHQLVPALRSGSKPRKISRTPHVRQKRNAETIVQRALSAITPHQRTRQTARSRRSPSSAPGLHAPLASIFSDLLAHPPVRTAEGTCSKLRRG